MEKLTACQILGVDAQADRRVIREAYARLSKQYHPEEHPEEFQQLHDAYETLLRGAGTRSEPMEQPEPDAPRFRSTASNASFHTEESERFSQNTDSQTRQEREPLNFDESVRIAQQKEQEQIHQTVLKAAAEIRILLQPQYQYKLKLFRQFFQNKEYQTALKTSEFMGIFASELKRVKLKGIIYDFIIDYYHLKNVDRNQIHQGARMLYDLLDQRRGIHKIRPGLRALAAPAGAVVALRIILRNAYRQSQSIAVLFWCALAVIGLVWLGKKLYENHSGIFAQFILAFILSVSQFFVVMFDLYAPVLGAENGVTAAVMIMMLAIFWMIGIAAAAILLKIKHLAERKR